MLEQITKKVFSNKPIRSKTDSNSHLTHATFPLFMPQLSRVYPYPKLWLVKFTNIRCLQSKGFGFVSTDSNYKTERSE